MEELVEGLVAMLDDVLPAAVDEKTAWLTWTGRILAVVIPVVLWFAPLSLEPRVQHALAITSFMIVAWITEALDHALTGVIGGCDEP